jgi:hypothetical protein
MTQKGPEQPIPADFSAFLELNSNKKEFDQFLGKQLSEEAPQLLHENQILVVGEAIDGKTVKITHSVSLELPELQSDLEEADQRIILHMKHALDTENRRHGLIIAADTDVCSYCSILLQFFRPMWIVSVHQHTSRSAPRGS